MRILYLRPQPPLLLLWRISASCRRRCRRRCTLQVNLDLDATLPLVVLGKEVVFHHGFSINTWLSSGGGLWLRLPHSITLVRSDIINLYLFFLK